MDIFDDVMTTLDLKGTLYFKTDFSAPWSVTVPRYENVARFHLVVQGTLVIKVEDRQPITLTAGDIILVPKGAQHILSDVPVSYAPPLETVLKDLNYRGEGVLVAGAGNANASTQLVCGHFSFRPRATHPLITALPDYLVISNAMRARYPLVDDTLRLLTRRMYDGDSGAAAAVVRLSEVVFIEILRSGIDGHSELCSVLDAFSDPKIGHSLRVIHSRLNEDWTVGSLAAEVAMSRSRFADKFSDLVGMAPMTYLADWRMQKALALIENTQITMQQIADQVGFHSPSAFTRAFVGKFGVSPTGMRKQA